MEYKGCNNCKYQPGPLLTCDWLKTQTAMFMRCPRWEPREQQDKPQMTKEQAIGYLKMAAPIRALTREEFEKFIIAINMAMEALEEKEEKPKEKIAYWAWNSKRFMYVCSECGENPTEGTGYNHDLKRLIFDFKYCRNCGARMITEDHEEEEA